MKKVIMLLEDETNRENFIRSAIQLAKLLKVEIELCHLVIAPHNWGEMGRTKRDNYPNTKMKVNEARLLMDEILSEIRLEKIKVKKKFLYVDPKENNHKLDFCTNDLILMEKSFYNRFENHRLNEQLFKLQLSVLIFNTPLDINSISDIVFTSDFHTIQPETVKILNAFYASLEINLNLVFINTKEKQENSDISINNMKSVIAANGFSRTGISIFYSDNKIQGAELFANLKGGDLIIMECIQSINEEKLEKLNIPILIINKKND